MTERVTDANTVSAEKIAEMLAALDPATLQGDGRLYVTADKVPLPFKADTLRAILTEFVAARSKLDAMIAERDGARKEAGDYERMHAEAVETAAEYIERAEAAEAQLARQGASINLTDEMVVAAMEHVPGCDHDDMVNALEAALARSGDHHG